MRKKHSVWMIPAAIALATMPTLAAVSPNVDTADYVLNNFDYFSKTTSLNGYWFSFTDNGSATAIDTIYGNSVLTAWDAPDQYQYDSLGNLNRQIFPHGHGNDSTNNALRFGFKLGDRRLSCGDSCTYPAYVGFGTGLKSNDTLDISAAAGIAFWAKADSATITFSVSISTRDTTPGVQAYAQTFKVDTNWKLCIIKPVASDSFAQPGWAPQTPFYATRATSLGWGINGGDNALHLTNALWIDDLVIQKWKYVEPEIPPDTIPEGVLAQAKKADRRFGIAKVGSNLRLRLPEIYVGQSGRVQAVDNQGRVIAESAFQAQSTVVEIPWESQTSIPGALHFRVISSKSIR